MKVIFCSSIYNMSDYKHLSERSQVPLSLADHNLNYNLIAGIDEVLGTPITLINNVQIPNYPAYPRIFFGNQQWSHTSRAQDINCGFINLPIIKHISRAFTTFLALKREITKTDKKESICVITYDLHFGISMAICMIKRSYQNITTCAVLPDVPKAVITAVAASGPSLPHKMRAQIKMSFIQMFDSYVFLTEQMKRLVDVSEKKYTVIEGIYNNNQPPLEEQTTQKKIILYTGQLNSIYGLNNLIDAFLRIYEHDRNYELWLCGAGPAEQRVRKLKQSCPGIKFFGYVDTKAVREYQSQATVLVNPRQNIDQFTKYSFPSKTMEYLASGRPVIGYKLDGIPAEYDMYIQYVPDNSVEALQNKLVEICELPKAQREAIGQKARTFILERKNPKVMCRRIIEMLEQG